MNLAPPPTSQLQEPDAVDALIHEGDVQHAADLIRGWISDWIDRTRQGGFRIPVLSDLLARVVQPPTVS